MSLKVSVIIINYNRPQNMQEVIKAWANQSLAPHRITVVDNSPHSAGITETYPAPHLTVRGVTDVWRIQENMGCPSRFIPAMAYFDNDYIVFADDDVAPGGQALANLVAHAEMLENCFSTIGQTGRLFQLNQKPENYYSGRSVPTRGKRLVKCHTTCQAHLVRQDAFQHILPFRHDMIHQFGLEVAGPLLAVHEDLLMNLSIQRGTGWPSYVIPTGEPEKELILHKLDETGACWRRPGHFEARSLFVKLALEMGWRPNV